MRRGLSRILLAALPALAVLVVAIVLLVSRGPDERVGPQRTAVVAHDSLARRDSTAPARRERDADPACLASHLGLPCRE